MYSNFFCEDNAGNIFVFVYYRDDLTLCICVAMKVSNL